jgi:hypothetical protein
MRPTITQFSVLREFPGRNQRGDPSSVQRIPCVEMKLREFGEHKAARVYRTDT